MEQQLFESRVSLARNVECRGATGRDAQVY